MATSTHRITRLGMVNAYLVREDDGLTLIDTAIPRSAKAILAAANELRVPIVRIALTHAHGDHVGSVDALAAQLGAVEVIISERDAPLLTGETTLREGEPGQLRGSYPGIKTKPTRVVTGGDRIGSLEVVPSPGHTPGHVAFLDTRDRTLYCGDVFSTLGGVATSAKVNWRFPLPALATWHRPTELQSARDVRDLRPDALAPGHGKVLQHPGAAMDQAIAAAG